jgi:hypothetical protein
MQVGPIRQQEKNVDVFTVLVLYFYLVQSPEVLLLHAVPVTFLLLQWELRTASQ